MDVGFQGFLLPGWVIQLLVLELVLMVVVLQKFPGTEAKGAANGEATGIQTGSDKDAMLYYHRIGTPQCMFILALIFVVLVAHDYLQLKMS